jgi:hypothetical protein
MTVGDNMADNQIETIETREVGRPCKYETHVEPYLDKIFEWLKTGYTDVSICEQLGIHQNTWMRYKQDYSVLSELYARARAHRNALVMNKMFEKAIGYEHEDLFIAQNKGEIVKETIKKHYPPDVNAADLFLRNNDPEYKSAKSVNDIGNLTINNFSLDDWQAKRQEILAEIKKLETITTSDYKVIDPDSD